MYVCIGKVVYKHFKFVQSLKQSVKWPSGTVADKDVNSKSLSLKDNPAVHTVYSEKGRFEYTRSSVYRTWHDVHSKQYLDNHKSTKIAITITVLFLFSYIPNYYQESMETLISQLMFCYQFCILRNERTPLITWWTPFIYGVIDRKLRQDCGVLFHQIAAKCDLLANWF